LYLFVNTHPQSSGGPTFSLSFFFFVAALLRHQQHQLSPGTIYMSMFGQWKSCLNSQSNAGATTLFLGWGF
jgi:hypothetical protein